MITHSNILGHSIIDSITDDRSQQTQLGNQRLQYHTGMEITFNQDQGRRTDSLEVPCLYLVSWACHKHSTGATDVCVGLDGAQLRLWEIPQLIDIFRWCIDQIVSANLEDPVPELDTNQHRLRH